MTPLVLVFLAQTAPPLVAVPSTPAAPYVVREHGEVCVVEPGEQGGEVRHCRKEGSEYTGAAMPPAPELKGKTRPEPEKPAVPSQLGFVLNLGAQFPLDTQRNSSAPGTAVHGRIGVRYALLDRSQQPGRANVSLALLGGGDVDGIHGGFGFEGRVEATAGGDAMLLEPLFNAFVSGGAQYLMAGQVPEFHLGCGVNFDFLFTGIFNGAGPLWFSSGNGTALAVVLFILAPSLEYRYVIRGDGTAYNAVLLSMGM